MFPGGGIVRLGESGVDDVQDHWVDDRETDLQCSYVHVI